MTITGQSSLARDDIERMVRDAEARNQADSLVYQTEKMLKDQASSFSGEQKETVEADLASLKTALSGSDLEAIKSATEKLAVGVQELGKQLYEQAAASAAPSADGAAANGAGAPNDDEVVDAEIVDEGTDA